MSNAEDIIDKHYHQDASKLLATLLRIVGPTNMTLAEDIIQDTFQRALEHWRKHDIPVNPSAWLMLTAKNAAIDRLRSAKRQNNLLKETLAPSLQSEWSLTYSLDQAFSEHLIEDNQLRLLFWVSSTELADAQRLPIVLKALCGMSVEAISRALLVNPDSIKKRLTRAKSQLAQTQYQIPSDDALSLALDKVNQSLYLMFNEGISAHNPKPTSRQEICVAALGYMRLVIAEPKFRNPETLALTALMHFHSARLPGRFAPSGNPLTLVEQDRSAWLAAHIKLGMALLQQALDAANQSPSKYLLEALIAFEHCRASSYENTDWQTINQHYQALRLLHNSPLIEINAAIASCQTGQHQKALSLLSLLSALTDDADAKIACRIHAAKAYIHWKMQDVDSAWKYADSARHLGLPEIDYQSLVNQFK